MPSHERNPSHAAAADRAPGLVLLTFDVEEFDAPLDYGHDLPTAEQVRLGGAGLDTVLDLLQRLGLRATLFTTANFAQQRPESLRRAASSHEIASHGYHHGRFEVSDLSTSRRVLQELTGQPITAFRMARMAPVDHAAVRAAGYTCNCSDNPIWLPGRYNNLRRPRLPYYSGDLLNVPASASPLLRVPLFWLAFKNLPGWIYRAAVARTLRADGFVHLYFHPWEFADIASQRLPWYVKRPSGVALVRRLEGCLRWLSARAEFVTLAEFEARWRRRSGGATPCR